MITKEEWMKMFREIPSPEGVPTETLIASRILGEMAGYTCTSRHREMDIKKLGAALEAYAHIMQPFAGA